VGRGSDQRRGIFAPSRRVPAPGLASLAAAGVVSAAAVSGGAFDPAVAAWVGAGAAITAGLVASASRLGTDAFEKALWACLVWAGIVASVRPLSPLASKEALASWLVAVIVMMAARRGEPRLRQPILAAMSLAAVLIVAGQGLDAIGTRGIRSAGVFVNPNIVVALLVPLIPLVLWAFSKNLGTGVAIALSVGVVLSGSRAGVLALAAALLVAARRGWQRRAVVVIVAAGAAVVWWRFAVHPDLFAWYRTKIWGALLGLLGAHPVLGIGPGGFPDATGVVRLANRTGCALHARRIGGAESMIVGWVVRTGIVGLALGLAAIGAAWKRLGRMQFWAGRGFTGALIAMGIMALFHDFFDVSVVLWWWALVLGIGMNDLGDDRAEEAPAQARSAAGRAIVGLVAAGLVLWGITQPALARIVAGRGNGATTVARAMRMEPWLDTAALGRVRALLARGRWTWKDAAEARRWSDRAARVHPGSVDAWSAVGDVNARIIADLGNWPSAVQRAREGYAAACRLEPRLPWAWVAWARLERALGHLEKARRLCQRATLAEPNCVRAWLLLGRLDLDLGRIDRARRDLEAARAARRCGRGRLLEAYDRDLMAAPPWQWQALERALP